MGREKLLLSIGIQKEKKQPDLERIYDDFHHCLTEHGNYKKKYVDRFLVVRDNDAEDEDFVCATGEEDEKEESSDKEDTEDYVFQD